MSARQAALGCSAKPWTPAYFEERQKVLEWAVADPDVARAFDTGGQLPTGFGRGMDERCVEYPWTLARLGAGPQRLLDAGSALNHPWLLDLPLFAAKNLHILTLAPEPHCAWSKGVSYIFSDLRDIPIRDGFYDRIACVSTLEHVGFDTSPYGGTAVAAPDWRACLDALLELRRVLRPGGELLVTLPFGVRENLVLAQQFDAQALEHLTEAFGPGLVETEFFRYTPGGWVRSTEAECATARYVRWAIDFFLDSRNYDLSRISPEPDGAAAARAVACVRLVKEERP